MTGYTYCKFDENEDVDWHNSDGAGPRAELRDATPLDGMKRNAAGCTMSRAQERRFTRSLDDWKLGLNLPQRCGLGNMMVQNDANVESK